MDKCLPVVIGFTNGEFGVWGRILMYNHTEMIPMAIAIAIITITIGTLFTYQIQDIYL